MGNTKRRRKRLIKPINLALQGGGAIGAFTWGVLDTLLEDGRLSFPGVSGTSAGAMNAVVLADGYEAGGAAGAQDKLARFWQGLSGENPFAAAADETLDALSSLWGLPERAPYTAIKQFTSLVSPYYTNPFNFNPLIQLVDEVVDFDRLRHGTAMKVFVSATNVRTGKIRLFTGKEIDASVVMASAALPYMFQAVEIDGESYWDGGYSGNPAMWPFFESTGSRDILLIQLDPTAEDKVPTDPQAIVDRMRALTFNNPLLHQLHAIQLIHKLLDAQGVDASHYERTRLHRIDAARTLTPDQIGRTADINPLFLGELRDAGRAAATDWLAAHFDDIGVRNTLDLDAEFA